jgi:hypothetical protein
MNKKVSSAATVSGPYQAQISMLVTFWLCILMKKGLLTGDE